MKVIAFLTVFAELFILLYTGILFLSRKDDRNQFLKYISNDFAGTEFLLFHLLNVNAVAEIIFLEQMLN